MVWNTFTEPIRKKSNRGYENRNRTEPWKSWTVPALNITGLPVEKKLQKLFFPINEIHDVSLCVWKDWKLTWMYAFFWMFCHMYMYLMHFAWIYYMEAVCMLFSLPFSKKMYRVKTLSPVYHSVIRTLPYVYVIVSSEVWMSGHAY